MKYSCKIEIDDDQWAKHPYRVTILDENGSIVKCEGRLNSWEACYRIADEYHIPHSEIEEEHY